jgi:hypothetical protein
MSLLELTKCRGLFTGCGVVDPTAMQAGALRVSQAPSDWSSIVAIMHGMVLAMINWIEDFVRNKTRQSHLHSLFQAVNTD